MKYLLEGLFPERRYVCSRCELEKPWWEYKWHTRYLITLGSCKAQRITRMCLDCLRQDRKDRQRRRERYQAGRAELATVGTFPPRCIFGGNVVDGTRYGSSKMVITNQADGEDKVSQPAPRPQGARRSTRPGRRGLYVDLPTELKEWLDKHVQRQGGTRQRIIADLLRDYRGQVEAVPNDLERLRTECARLRGENERLQNPKETT